MYSSNSSINSSQTCLRADTHRQAGDLGSCPTNEHSARHPQCGFAGCVDLRPWAKANRYRFRLEESYKAENNTHVRGDGRWFVEIPCKSGLIYPWGREMLLAYAKSGVQADIARLAGVELYQTDGKARVFIFPVDRLDEVAAILKPRRRRMYTPEHREVLRERLKSLRQRGANRSGTNDQAGLMVGQG
jgi:hypothetical protein